MSGLKYGLELIGDMSLVGCGCLLVFLVMPGTGVTLWHEPSALILNTELALSSLIVALSLYHFIYDLVHRIGGWRYALEIIGDILGMGLGVLLTYNFVQFLTGYARWEGSWLLLAAALVIVAVGMERTLEDATK